MSDLRTRLGRLADEEASGLDAAARTRVVERVGQSGPGLVKAAHRRRVAVRAGSGVAVVAVAVVAWNLSKPSVAPCTTWAPIASATIEPETSLGRRGRVESDPGTRATVQATDACVTTIALEVGRVVVHADDLGGGALRVRTIDGDVEVHGTVFSVSVEEMRIEIAVTEGRVAWKARGQAPLYLGASESFVATRAVAANAEDPPEHVVAEVAESVEEDLTERRAPKRRRVRRARRRADPEVEAPSTEPAAEEPSSEALVRRAEAMRRAGNVAGARAAYRAAGRLGDSTAEAAWIALARYELELGRPRDALDALRRRTRAFRSGNLEQEAEWIAVRALAASGQPDRARTKAEQIRRRWPGSPQAKAAGDWLEAQP